MSKRRVVVTGMGIISPVGNTVDAAWNSIVGGKSGIGPIIRFDVSNFSTRIGGSISDFDANEIIGRQDARRTDAFMHYGIAASQQAMQDSGIEVDDKLSPRFGVAMGAGIGGLELIENTYVTYLKSGPRRISPFFIPGSIVNMVSGHVSIRYGLTGPNIALATACTTATHSIGIAARIIAYGDADAMVAGGSEMATTPLGLGGFCSAKALSTRNDDPEHASRPWDRDRDGFVLGDGAGALILEEYDHAKRRNAQIHAEIVGFGMSGDAFHITAPLESGAGARACMVNAVKDAGLNMSDVDYVNAHGTSTPLGDKAESDALKQAFGNHASSLMVSSTKSMTGHLLGAAGAVEAIFSILALQNGVIPPTINLENPDLDCDLDYVPNVARDVRIRTALSNSFGFGGTNGTLVFQAVD